MARKIIVFERLGGADSNFRDISLSLAFWADVPATRQSFYADSSKTSSVKGITAGELADIKNGVILEKVSSCSYSPGTTATQIKSDLVSKFNDFQNSIISFNPYQYYGTSWDGTSWTNGGVA